MAVAVAVALGASSCATPSPKEIADRAGSEPTADIGGAAFQFVAKGSNAWLKNPAEEGKFVETLKRGSKLVVKASSAKGNASTDSYSLAGISDALARIRKECQ